jgi:CRISPR/Cas system-associated exonuclease Cas4 (RecB family)
MSEVAEKKEKKITISAKQVKTVLRCEYLYYLEYVQKKEYPKSEAMTLGLEVHERVSGPLIQGLSIDEAKEVNKEDPFSRVVYSLLPKNGNPKVETKYFVDMGSYQRVVIPDFLYEDSIYDLKTTSSENAYKTVYSDDIIQLHYYWETLGGNRDTYIIKLLLPKGYGKAEVSSTYGSHSTAAYANLFKIKIGKEVIGDIHFAERRIMEILDGAKPTPSPGRACRTCPFNQSCPFSAYKPEPEKTV